MYQKLFSLQDLTYRDFQAKLLPTVAKEKIIGVRTPALQLLAKEIFGTEESIKFLKSLPHKYFDENQLHVLLISLIPQFDEALATTELFLPYIDNWATCDQLRPKSFSKNLDKLLLCVKNWLKSSHVYTVRFAIGMLLAHFLDSNFKPEFLQFVASVKSDEYYVNMMCAWYFATALDKQYETTIPLLEQNLLDQDVHNKTIRKAIESLRIKPEQKKYLKTLKRK